MAAARVSLPGGFSVSAATSCSSSVRTRRAEASKSGDAPAAAGRGAADFSAGRPVEQQVSKASAARPQQADRGSAMGEDLATTQYGTAASDDSFAANASSDWNPRSASLP